MANYHFITQWELRAPLEKVYEVLHDTDNYPQWWKYIAKVETVKKTDNEIGTIKKYFWRTALPYTLSFSLEATEVEQNALLTGRATGDLEGTGTWKFYRDNDITRVLYFWNVRTTKSWMNFFAPLAKPFFNWNHNLIMRAGARALAKKLNAGLITC